LDSFAAAPLSISSYPPVDRRDRLAAVCRAWLRPRQRGRDRPGGPGRRGHRVQLLPPKEDLFYSRLEAFGDQLVEAIGARPAGEPALAAFGRFLLDSGGWLRQAEAGDSAALDRLRTVNRLIAASPALLAREQLAIARSTRALADLLADQTGAGPGDIAPRVAANALMGVQRALLGELRRRVLAGEEPARLAADIRASTRQALALLEHGLGDYGAGPPPRR
jgi:hypothetical protein